MTSNEEALPRGVAEQLAALSARAEAAEAALAVERSSVAAAVAAAVGDATARATVANSEAEQRAVVVAEAHAVRLALWSAFRACSRKLTEKSRHPGWDGGHRSLLFLAAEDGDAARVCFLVAVDPMQLDATEENEGWTAAHVAAENADLAVLSLLADLGANLDITNEEMTPLSLAAARGHVDVVRFLMEWGASVMVPLYHGASRGQLACVRLLAPRCTNFDWDAGFGTPLSAAAAANQLPVAEFLVVECGANVNSGTSTTPLHAATNCGHIAVARFLLASGAGVDHHPTKNPVTPLWLAVNRNDQAMAELFLDAGADATRAHNQWSTALSTAAARGNDALVLLLATRGAPINDATTSRRSALGAAMAGGHIGTVRLLADLGSDPRCVVAPATRQCNWGPAVEAEFGGHAGMMRAFVNVGGDFEDVSPDGRTGLCYAAQCGRASAVALVAATLAHTPIVNDGGGWWV